MPNVRQRNGGGPALGPVHRRRLPVGGRGGRRRTAAPRPTAEPIFEWRQRNQGATSEAAAGILNDLAELLIQEPDDDYIIRPTEYAFTTAKRLLADVDKKMSGLPRGGSVSPDGEGGLRIEWTGPGREVRLICKSRPEQQGYVYYEAGDSYSTRNDVTVDSLTHLLRWLNNA